ncbi:DUF2789 domain-containing protein [Vibrio sp. CK2-1]|uniref:DUF2789 domain-containing protein n=1 Tax=Vibrio sp. CK2-1 TaxID=2912249 RepID=UPI001F3D70B2|nr:DUF2789 domain-containing protein [Vibrio sp. CK2-1]MCF7355038.1 DUF2789 domain-containing protein [Vibrio sp. CK2-1]
MEMHRHSLETLFEQLGLASSSKDIEAFIAQHADQLDHSQPLHRAPFWTASQSTFIKEAKKEDADWVEVVDQLDTLFRAQSTH